MSESRPMRISIFGLGYVGAVTAACLAQRGHQVTGVDVSGEKVALINQGRSPILEQGIEALIAAQVAAGRLTASTDALAAVLNTELSIICVGTPSMANGDLNTHYAEVVSRDIGIALSGKSAFHFVALRSTVLPGITRQRILPILEQASGKRAGEGFGLCFNPEFLREATAIDDFNKPPKTIVGELDARSGDAIVELYKDLPAPIFRTTIETAEMAKYADNAFHALKVSFANEIGSLCKPTNVDSHELMAMFCQDTKLNLSPYYLKPGFIFGGSCLPKDLRAVGALARKMDVRTPVLDSILPSNDAHLERALALIRSTAAKTVGVLGVSFKSGTDDVRESPSVRLIELLRRDGLNVLVYDEQFNLSRVMGENRRYLLDHVPEFHRLFVDGATVASQAEVLVLTLNSATYRTLVNQRRRGQIVVDLVHADGCAPREDYHILC
jgi:GDP-mannose 6-dehydrogenase